MPAILTTADTISCTDGQGTVQVSGADKLVIDNSAVLTEQSVLNQTVSGCAMATTDKTSPCTQVISISDGRATKLIVSGSPVLLSGLSGTAAATKPHSIGPASAGQTKLEAT